jgi:hypothetical protein
VMGTYATAQYLIVRGLLASKDWIELGINKNYHKIRFVSINWFIFIYLSFLLIFTLLYKPDDLKKIIPYNYF